jgi:cysteine desulfurase / selenocysteine lyase
MTVAAKRQNPDVTTTQTPLAAYDPQKIRANFPILYQRVNGKPLVYLDNAATTQKPRMVIDSITQYYEANNANIHRGVHYLSQLATQKYEDSRETVRRFLNAAEASEIVFVRGATEGINLIAQTLGRTRVRSGDEVLITAMEHHSNIVPWQILCEEKGAILRVAPMNDAGELVLDEFARLLGTRTKIVAVPHVSNALGTVNPLRQMVELAHRHNAVVVVDGAQAVPHLAVDVRALDCDFYVFSGHKLYGPTGIGVLYGKSGLLNAMPPYQGGGDMILSVTFEKTTYHKIPYKFEAGTPDISGAIALGTAINYVTELGLDRIQTHERDLLRYATESLARIPGIRLIGTAKEKAGVLSFVMDGIHPHDIGTILDQEGIAIRTGHHCAQPVMERFGIPASARASFALYNTREEVDALVRGIDKVHKVLV